MLVAAVELVVVDVAFGSRVLVGVGLRKTILVGVETSV